MMMILMIANAKIPNSLFWELVLSEEYGLLITYKSTKKRPVLSFLLLGLTFNDRLKAVVSGPVRRRCSVVSLSNFPGHIKCTSLYDI